MSAFACELNHTGIASERLMQSMNMDWHILQSKALFLIGLDPCSLIFKSVFDAAYEESERTFELHHEKTNVLVSDLVRHKSGCTATEDG